MPSIIDKATERKQAAWWDKPEPTGFPGEGVFVAPVEIGVRESFREKTRENEDESVMLVDRDMQTGGFIRIGKLSELNPNNAAEYPPTTPEELNLPTTHHKFEDDLTGENGNDMSVITGSTVFVTGIVDLKALTDGNEDYTTSTDSAVAWASTEEFTIGFWYKASDPGGSLDVVSHRINVVGNLNVLLESGITDKITANTTEWDLAPGWADDFVHIAIVWEKDVTPKLFVAGLEITPTIAGSPTSSAFSDSDIDMTVLVDTVSGIGDTILDDLRTYVLALSDTNIQLLAAVHPNLYPEAEEILDYQAVDSLNGRNTVRKIILKHVVALNA